GLPARARVLHCPQGMKVPGRQRRLLQVFGCGMVGGVLMTLGMMIARAIDVTPMNFELSLGALLTTQIDALAWFVGFGAHLSISGLIALVYYAGFLKMRRGGAGMGLQFSLLHWIASGVLMQFIPRLYSLAPGLMPAPGFFGFN